MFFYNTLISIYISINIECLTLTQRGIHKRRHSIRGGKGQGFYDGSTRTLVIINIKMGGVGFKSRKSA
jgi:hypothetical protein